MKHLKMTNAEEKSPLSFFFDSRDFKKLKAYPNKPRQYFASLPNFADLKMAARKRATSDITKMANQIARETIAL